MAAVFAGKDAAATSIGFPIRNMHTMSESANTCDVQAAVHAITAAIQAMDERRMTRADLEQGHVRLDAATAIDSQA
jgi:endoglucanase